MSFQFIDTTGNLKCQLWLENWSLVFSELFAPRIIIQHLKKIYREIAFLDVYHVNLRSVLDVTAIHLPTETSVVNPHVWIPGYCGCCLLTELLGLRDAAIIAPCAVVSESAPADLCLAPSLPLCFSQSHHNDPFIRLLPHSLTVLPDSETKHDEIFSFEASVKAALVYISMFSAFDNIIYLKICLPHNINIYLHSAFHNTDCF